MKYPRTYHLPWSPGATSDDKIQYDLEFAEKNLMVWTEKMDGENTTMTRDKIWARSLHSNNHPSRNWVKGLWGNIRHEIPENFRICGENLYAKHSIFYDKLPSYFMVFSIWDGRTCLSYPETLEWCTLLGLHHVPVLQIANLFSPIEFAGFAEHFLDLNKQEGIVLRPYREFHVNDFSTRVLKWVRANHVQTSNHWASKPIEKNILIRTEKSTNFVV